MYNYRRTISFWDDIFGKQTPKHYDKSMKIHKDLESAIDWISVGSKSILDYGCGSGAMIFKCAEKDNICKCLGIDISPKAVEFCKSTARLNNLETKVEFCCGQIEILEKIKENSFDAAILSNIIDNIMPNDAELLINNIKRIVTPNGKILIKLNPYLSQEQIEECGCKLLYDNLYVESDGIYLRNLSTTQWKDFIEQFFKIEEYKEIYFEQFNQSNRMFLLINSK
ncbi:MAG TPA: class I SAM-dependent methyltransferase [Clostridiaceae bacterium]|jgi:ubiquinone/menaquinone biosynthesis C-methylase UbiE|nr:class I SAM-dependent methyltransferase [Clostridiaceae bacterium]HBF78268.1 class I SAM-dependent methyltransferase [Clostridiaceae bacterium]HBG38159.1 class I SAM-dependent methyltransferase [Clostridiaceae bacterium]HBN28207.1 class I SAM-dependent methyltransferase [Clostridiaceae bacterium]HBX47922.1 class I SAM-dependent methyltransferase [Clostridiaceae bacterium]